MRLVLYRDTIDIIYRIGDRQDCILWVRNNNLQKEIIFVIEDGQNPFRIEIVLEYIGKQLWN